MAKEAGAPMAECDWSFFSKKKGEQEDSQLMNNTLWEAVHKVDIERRLDGARACSRRAASRRNA